MKYCKKNGEKLTEGVKRCGKCGAPINNKTNVNDSVNQNDYQDVN